MITYPYWDLNLTMLVKGSQNISVDGIDYVGETSNSLRKISIKDTHK